MTRSASRQQQSLADLERGFACPQAGLDQDLFELIVVEHGRQTLQAFVERDADAPIDSDGLIELLAGASETLRFETAWDAAFGGIHACLLSNQDHRHARAAACALRLHECGTPGAWQVRLQHPACFRFGNIVFKASADIRAEATAQSVTLRLDSGRASRDISLARGRAGWVCASGDVVQLPVVDGSGWTIWNADMVASWEYDGLRESMTVDDPQPLREGAARAWEALAKFGGIYASWVKRVIRHLVPWEADPNTHPSGSSSSSCVPGVIGIGNHAHPLSLADTLVHEATHQYFYVAGKLGAIDDGSDANLYFNPFLDLDRPIGRILLAYHAFANILLLCRTLQANGYSDEYVVKREAYLEPRLATMADALADTRALTPLGRRIADTLIAQVHAGPVSVRNARRPTRTPKAHSAAR